MIAGAEQTLTPALSLSERERENHLPAHGTSRGGIHTPVVGPSKSVQRLFPRPIRSGEGPGAGIWVERSRGA